MKYMILKDDYSYLLEEGFRLIISVDEWENHLEKEEEKDYYEPIKPKEKDAD